MASLRLGTRGSQLALWQARAVAARLESFGHRVELVVIKTSGDRLQDAPALSERGAAGESKGPALSERGAAGESKGGGKRLFVKDLEDALLSQDIDLAVHSAKDLPAGIPEGLSVDAALPREDPRDAIVLPGSPSSSDLATLLSEFRRTERRTVGTGSVRRVAQLSPQMPGAVFKPIRGNVDTRLRKLDAGEFDALVLACAGMRRLNLDSRITAALPVGRCVPAPGQGIVVVESREGDTSASTLLRALRDEAASVALTAERSLVEALGGDCQIPLGALARLDGAGIELTAVVCSLDGLQTIRRHARGPAGHPEQLGKRLADELAVAGGAEILDKVRRATHPPKEAY